MELDPVSVSSFHCPCRDHMADRDRRLFSSGTMIGFDASGHIAEETKNARYASSSSTEDFDL